MTEEDAEAFVVLDAALQRLEDEHPRAARGVECRFFAGMTIEETAEALGVSERTVSRDWTHAQLWLYREMKRIRSGGETPDGEGSDDERSLEGA
jgi:RNA polymerase sigma factor (sigma-70 family)